MVENVEGSQGNFRDTYNRPEGDWLTRDEAVEEYGRLSSFVYRNLKAYNGSSVDYLELYQKCGYLEYKIRNLLSHHHITVLSEDTMFRVLMSGTGVDDNGIPFEGRIQVAEFASIPRGCRQIKDFDGDLTLEATRQGGGLMRAAHRRHDMTDAV